MALTGRAALLAALGAVIVAVAIPSWWGILAVEGTLAVFVVADVTLAGSVRTLTVTRAGDTSVRLGEPAQVDLVVGNPGPRRVRGLVRDAWQPSAGAASQRFGIDVPPSERRRIAVHLRPTRRGDRLAETVTIRSIGPLGLAARQGSHRVPWVLRVLPPFTARRHLPSRLARLRDLAGRSALLIRGPGTEFDSLREYVIGDDVRSIDWRATARSSEVVVRTWRPERDRHVLIVMDTGRTSAGRVGDQPRLDSAMDAALLLAALATRAGDRVDLLAYDRQVRAAVERPAPSEVLHSFVRAMANLDPQLVETDYRGLASQIMPRAGRHALVVLLTGLESAVIEEGLLPVLASLVRRHTVLVASVADPRVAELAGGRGDAAAIYGAAAAEQALAERRHVTGILERRGVFVVDALPAELAPALSDAYLDLKRTGRL